MRTTIDKAGRLVIPRAIRESAGIPYGGEVEISVDGAGIRVEPTGIGGLREDDGLLVIDADERLTVEAVQALRDADRR